MLERITGPIQGYYIAAYACAMGELQSECLGYFKICVGAPNSYWEADCLFKDCTEAPVNNPHAALREAEDAARRTIGTLPPIPFCLGSLTATRSFGGHWHMTSVDLSAGGVHI